jgi:hypothetical protein
MIVGGNVDESQKCNNTGIVYFFSTFPFDPIFSFMKILKTIYQDISPNATIING